MKKYNYLLFIATIITYFGTHGQKPSALIPFEQEYANLQQSINSAYEETFGIPSVGAPSPLSQPYTLFFEHVDVARKARQPLVSLFGKTLSDRIPLFVKNNKLGNLLEKVADKYAQTHHKLYSALYNFYYNVIDQEFANTMKNKGIINAQTQHEKLQALKPAIEDTISAYTELERESKPLRNPKLFTGIIVLDKEKQRKQQKAQALLVSAIDKLHVAIQKVARGLMFALEKSKAHKITPTPRSAPAQQIAAPIPTTKPVTLPEKQIQAPQKPAIIKQEAPGIPAIDVAQLEQELKTMKNNINTVTRNTELLNAYLDRVELREFENLYPKTLDIYNTAVDQYETLNQQLRDREDTQSKRLLSTYITPARDFVYFHGDKLTEIKRHAQEAAELRAQLHKTNNQMRKDAGLTGKEPVNQQLESMYKHWLQGVKADMNRVASREHEKHLLPVYKQFFAHIEQIEQKPK